MAVIDLIAPTLDWELVHQWQLRHYGNEMNGKVEEKEYEFDLLYLIQMCQTKEYASIIQLLQGNDQKETERNRTLDSSYKRLPLSPEG